MPTLSVNRTEARPTLSTSLSAWIRLSVSRTEPAPAMEASLHVEPMPDVHLAVSRTEEADRQSVRLHLARFHAPAAERPLPPERP